MQSANLNIDADQLSFHPYSEFPKLHIKAYVNRR